MTETHEGSFSSNPGIGSRLPIPLCEDASDMTETHEGSVSSNPSKPQEPNHGTESGLPGFLRLLQSHGISKLELLLESTIQRYLCGNVRT